MSTARHVEQSLFPDHAPDKPVGPILPSVFTGTNSDLMAAVAPYYLTGSAHDLKTDGVDFTALPEADGTYDAVCFDPPYIPQGGTKDEKVGARFRSGFGLVQRSEKELWGLIAIGMSETARVLTSDGFLLVKCTDYCNGARMTFGHVRVMELAAERGLSCHDLIVHHTGSGPGGHNIFTPIRARRHHSYLLVFTKDRR